MYMFQFLTKFKFSVVYKGRLYFSENKTSKQKITDFGKCNQKHVFKKLSHYDSFENVEYYFIALETMV